MKQTTVRHLISLGMLLVLIVMFSILSPYFLSPDNLLEVARDASVVGIIGVGVTYVIITAGIDLSTGSAMALVGMTMANIYAYTVWPIWIMLVFGILVGLLAGLFNGFVVARLHLPEFIATLATMGIYRALTYAIAIRDAGGVIQSQAMTDSGFTALGGAAGPVYLVTIALIAAIVIGQIVLKYTRFGTNLYAVGASQKAAALSGINIAKVRILAYVVTGFCVAVGAIFTTARLQSTTALLGDGFEFDPIAAAVVGGVALSGGSGDIVGTLIGALFMAALDNGVLKLHMNTAYQYIIKGIILILVVMFDAWYKGRMEKAAQEKGVKEAAAENE
ncbi:MAG TPA: ABC transporter permease [Lachnospiraceae bacterium]|nr:ABC transporter permease [Lachnospiraceae bacterium]